MGKERFAEHSDSVSVSDSVGDSGDEQSPVQDLSLSASCQLLMALAHFRDTSSPEWLCRGGAAAREMCWEYPENSSKHF